MVLLTTIIGGMVLAVVGYFTVGAVATLASWIAVGSALIIGGGSFYRALQENYLEFDSEVMAGLSYGVIGAVVGFVSYRLIEAAFAAFGLLAAFLAVVLLGAGVLLGFGTVLSALAQLIGLVFEVVSDG